MQPEGHNLLLAFDTDDAEFARGFEAGCIWSLLRRTDDDQDLSDLVVHGSNAEMLIRMAEAMGRRAVADLHDDTWATATFVTGEYVESDL
jgi:hypothetical protein